MFSEKELFYKDAYLKECDTKVVSCVKDKDLYKVIERDNTYYLYINKYKAFIVSKEGISKNNIEKLSNNFKYKVSTYKYIK